MIETQSNPFRYNDLHPLERWGLPLLLLLVVLTRVPFFTVEPYSWDAFNFTMGVERFSPSNDMPHFPGYFLHIGLGKLFAMLLGDAQAGLHATSLLYSLITITAIFMFTRAFIAPLLKITSLRDVAAFSLSTAALAAFNPMFWHFNETELAYDGGAMIGMVTGALIILAPRIRGGWILAAGSIALFGGIRPDSAMFGLYWVLWALWNRVSLKQWLLSSIAVIVCTAAWIVPAIIAAGGIADYFGVGGDVFSNAREMDVINAGGLLPLIRQKAIGALGWTFFTIGPGILAVFALGNRSWKSWKTIPRQLKWILVLWSVPPILISAIYFHGGHFLLAFAPCTIGVSALLWGSFSKLRSYLVAVLIVVLAGTAWFVLPILPDGRTLPYTRGRIEANDIAMKSWRDAVTTLNPGQNDAILFYTEEWPWRAAVRDFPNVPSYQINPMPEDQTFIVGARLLEEFIPDEHIHDLFSLPINTQRLFVPSMTAELDRVLTDFKSFQLIQVIDVPEVGGVISVYQKQ
ncbi:MAG TPA: hypothetical protein ENH10_06150 [Bacteroidetes bacterium]|nr:hypothetical protein BMS3Bbin04_01415 [bacterium BMS3Bbin04]HDO65601.1 hypothetical protein [Bacteroidota bacterium]HEX04726.1 hypothetical protein [Bacteroidota bacterium]